MEGFFEILYSLSNLLHVLHKTWYYYYVWVFNNYSVNGSSGTDCVCVHDIEVYVTGTHVCRIGCTPDAPLYHTGHIGWCIVSMYMHMDLPTHLNLTGSCWFCPVPFTTF